MADVERLTDERLADMARTYAEDNPGASPVEWERDLLSALVELQQRRIVRTATDLMLYGTDYRDQVDALNATIASLRAEVEDWREQYDALDTSITTNRAKDEATIAGLREREREAAEMIEFAKTQVFHWANERPGYDASINEAWREQADAYLATRSDGA